jgi:hypothetical protein
MQLLYCAEGVIRVTVTPGLRIQGLFAKTREMPADDCLLPLAVSQYNRLEVQVVPDNLWTAIYSHADQLCQCEYYGIARL